MKYHIFHVFRVVLGVKQVQTTQKQVLKGEIGPRICFSTFWNDYSPIFGRNQLFLIILESSPDLEKVIFFHVSEL